ncbi:MAG: hypothetical protein KIT54_02975 [Phycisphaeraceae bacterium]|nr:hypothetical protein [Phycisphaeraceae bacterium]
MFWIALFGGALAPVCRGQVFFRVIESEVATASRAEVHAPPTPLVADDTDSDPSQPFPLARTEAQVGGVAGVPRASSIARVSGRLLRSTTLTLEAQASFDLERSSLPSTPRRVAAGSWSQYVRFEIVRAARLDLRVQPGLFDELEYGAYAPGTLTGPEGVIVSGPPVPGAPSWIWQLTLQPGEYTFEANAAFEIGHDGAGRLSDSARHDVWLTLRPLDCLADFDGDGTLTAFDFLLFQNLFAVGASEADFDGDGTLTIFDFLAYQNAFARGCE